MADTPATEGGTSTAATKPPSALSLAAKLAGSSSDGVGSEGSRSSLSHKLKLRAAIRATIVATRNKRRFADGSLRNDVKEGAAKEAHAHGPAGGMAFLSSRAQAAFEHAYTALGGWVEKHHHLTMAIGLLILLSGIPGTAFLSGKAQFLWFKVDSDLSAFALTSTPAYKSYEHAIHMHHGVFHPPRPSLAVFSPQPGADHAVLSHGFMARTLDIVNEIYDTTVTGADGTVYGFEDLCAPTGDVDRAAHGGGGHRRLAPAAGRRLQGVERFAHCASRGADLFSNVGWSNATLGAVAGPGAGAANGWSDFGAVLHQAALAKSAAMSGAFNATGAYRVALQGSIDPSDDAFQSWAPATLQVPFQMFYTSDAALKEVQTQWETKVADYLVGKRYPHADAIRATVGVESTFETAMQDSLWALTPWIFVVVVVMVLYSGAFLATQTRTCQGEATQFSLVAQGSAVSGLAGFSSFGWMYYLGFESINVLCICAVFLVAAVGVDCTFIFVSAMKATGSSTPLADAVPMAMAEGASAITLTSLTSICAFLVAAATSSAQPAFVKFNTVMAIALLLNFLGFITFFAGWQVHNEHRIADGKKDLNPLAKRDTTRRLPGWVDVGGKLRLLINNAYAPNLIDHRALGKPLYCKLLGLAVMLATFIVSCAFVGSIGVGMPDEYLVLDSSYLYDLKADFRDRTHGKKTLVVSMLVEHLDLGSMAKLEAFSRDVLGALRDRDDVLMTSCLPGLYYAYAAGAAAGGATPDDWGTWLNASAAAQSLYGHSYYGEETGQFSGAAVPRELTCTVTALSPSGADSVPRIEVMDWFEDLAARLNAKYADTCFPCDATRVSFYSHEWAMKTSFDKELPSLCWSTIAMALLTVGVVLLLALPVHRALISVLNIFLVVFAIIGFMGYAGISYNLISYCTLTMAIGFCVDYTVELMHFSVIGEPDDSMGVKFANALKACGYDVLHGCMTAILGVLLLGLSGAMYARLFSYLSLVMCLYGGAYALWCLPSSMTLTSMLVPPKKGSSGGSHGKGVLKKAVSIESAAA